MNARLLFDYLSNKHAVRSFICFYTVYLLSACLRNTAIISLAENNNVAFDVQFNVYMCVFGVLYQ